MHIPDGIIDGTTSATIGLVAGAGVAVAVRAAGRELDERQVPLTGLAAAFVFAAQMFNFPVIAGMSGHLAGGVLAAVLLGPAGGLVVIAVVLFVQSLVFADGGLTALGLNVANLGMIGAVGGYLIFVAVRPLAERRRRDGVVVAGAVAAFVSVPLAALAFVGEFAVGATVEVSVSSVLWAMLASHVLIGIGEAAITGMILAAIVKTRPDIVHGHRSAPQSPIVSV